MMGMNPQAFLQQMMQRNPNMANNPQAKEIINVLMSGDSQRGQEMAQNLCRSYNVSPEEAMNQASSFFKKNFRF